MKRLVFFVMITFLIMPQLSTIYANESSDVWQTTIKAVGQQLGGTFEEDITIGMGQKSVTVEAPPMPPPKYSVTMDLTDLKGPLLKKDIRDITGYQEWVFVINPSGNIMPPIPRTSTLSWDISTLGKGTFSLKKGFDGHGETVVEDMKSIDSLDITGYGKVFYTICYTPIN
jgi:hypothetical protein